MKRHKHSSGWFGSLATLSLRRPSSRRKASAPPQDGSRIWPADDTEAGPHLRGYARSGAMYTHVGTVPRRDRQPSKMNTDWEEGEARTATAEHVRDSPLLGALSSLSLHTVAQSSCAPAEHVQDMSKGAPAGRDVSKANLAPLEVYKNIPVPQDIYVHMDAVSSPETAKNSQEVEHLHSPMDGCGEYVKFSQDEKFWQEKQLQEEQKLSAANLRSHAWYHGSITRQVSEALVLNQGDFLIRDSESNPADFVLTTRWDQKTNHFPVRSTAAHCGLLYSLDQESFDSMPALVRFYVGRGAPLTRRSAARIQRPVSRTLPLRYLETTIGLPPCQPTPSQAEEVCPKSAPSLHRRQPALSSPADDIPRLSTSAAPSPSPSISLDPALPELHPDIQATDPDGSCYTELYPCPQSFVERLREEEGPRAVDVDLPLVVETASSFAPTNYCSPLMPGENKPLEVGILQRVKELLAGTDPQTAARHITKWDCTVARILEVRPEMQRMMGVSSGVELLTLPHGQQLRLDLLERLHTMATMLAVNVLGCTGTTEERAYVLHRMIAIAAELKSSMGNLYGFAAVMRALELPQVTRLEQTWTALRQRHTEGAVLYEKTLKPFMKSLNEGRESCPASGTTFPHVLPLLRLLEKGAAVNEGPQGAEEDPWVLGAEAWETAEASVDVDVLMFHLAAARNAAQLGAVYATNACSKLQDFQEQTDISQVFCTDFQMRLLWGSRGAAESQARRYAKFNQVLTALSKRLEPPTC
ncbi:SH2 domain containing 3Cb isoform X1 [Syngnathus acus]|uniref:SH2 domain containing 3Cb isoform X1 n=1 Tax=Syngnathus acus TaxID=161584 RepID=UPI001886386D|nr:SH2 domain containing 3Cb isoform X1 [Syngnathus acus]